MNIKIIGKVATFFGIVSTVFVVLSALITYYLLQIASPTAPTNYVAFLILSDLLPYLFLSVLSTVIAVLFRSLGKERSKKDELPQVQTTLNS
jgi:hypothetical protein